MEKVFKCVSLRLLNSEKGSSCPSCPELSCLQTLSLFFILRKEGRKLEDDGYKYKLWTDLRLDYMFNLSMSWEALSMVRRQEKTLFISSSCLDNLIQRSKEVFFPLRNKFLLFYVQSEEFLSLIRVSHACTIPMYQ